MFGLIDCNSFYCSAEQVFLPKTRNKAVVVLSNNDGCVISRSKEAKVLGITMGEPAFKREEFYLKNDVYVFSSNYVLYGDMSKRVMDTISSMVQNIEVYSIDESFVTLDGYTEDLNDYGNKIRNRVKRWTGIPVGVGIAQTKTLSKVANKLAKKSGGVCVIKDGYDIAQALYNYDIADIWGIGRQYDAKLKRMGIDTAGKLIQLNDNWVLKNLTKVGLKMVKELRGEPCYDLDEIIPAKKGVCSARSFGHDITDYQTIYEALSNYTARVAEKLRAQNSFANILTVFIETNSFKINLPQYRHYKTLVLPIATNSTIELIKYAEFALRKIYKKGYAYKKVGILLMGITPEVQDDFFYSYNDKDQSTAMKVLDSINKKYGRDTLRVAAQGVKMNWWMRQLRLTPRYTTSWNELMKVKAEDNYVRQIQA
jgi:DNA polymerase V